MNILRTPEECFNNLPDYDFAPNYLMVIDPDSGKKCIRLHYVDEGPPEALPVLLMHGEPSWSYLYRKMIPPLVAAGYRVIAPDLIGFGRSDKPSERSDYTYQGHVDWMTQCLHTLNLQNIVLFCQDWGGLIGLRLIAEQTKRFAGVVAANTFLPTGDIEPNEAFKEWQHFSQTVPEFPVGGILQGATVSSLSADVIAAYDAPFPDETYKAGAREFPLLVPITPDDPAANANRAAWARLCQLEIPFLTAFSDQDPVSAGGEKAFQKLIPGCQGQAHAITKGGGHFLQEDKGEELAKRIIAFIESNKLSHCEHG